MAVPEVSSCCGFVSLRTGAKICGFIAFVGSLFLTILSTLEMIFRDEAEESGSWGLGLHLELAIDIAVQVIHMIASGSLILGAYQEQPSLVKPWLVTAILVALIEIPLNSLLSRLFVFGGSHSPLLLWIGLSVLMLVDDVYGWLVVYSYYRSINTATSNA